MGWASPFLMWMAGSGYDATQTTEESYRNFLESYRHAGLFVEATLVRSDTGAPIAKCLDGNSIARFDRSAGNGDTLVATFKKLKILSTSQQLQVQCAWTPFACAV